MTWWMIIVLCYVFYALGVINATVAERERHWAWMFNSWELLSRRLWWLKMVKMPEQSPTPEDYQQLTKHMLQAMNDYNSVFGRDYNKEKMLTNQAVIGYTEPDV